MHMVTCVIVSILHAQMHTSFRPSSRCFDHVMSFHKELVSRRQLFSVLRETKSKTQLYFCSEYYSDNPEVMLENLLKTLGLKVCESEKKFFEVVCETEQMQLQASDSFNAIKYTTDSTSDSYDAIRVKTRKWGNSHSAT